MYLHTPLDEYEYMKILLAIFPSQTIKKYDLEQNTKGGLVYDKIHKAVYGLPQAGTLANKLLHERLAPAGYYEVKHTQGLWCHITRPIVFLFVVDNFGVKYVGKEHTDHLTATVKKFYPLLEDWEGKLYYSIELNWNYGAI
ncbi:hypothetical protein ACHAWF_008260 [Thalassiosira exigua]